MQLSVPGSALTPTSTSRWTADAVLTGVLFLVFNVVMAGQVNASAITRLAGMVMVLAMVLRRHSPMLMLGLVSMCGVIVAISSSEPIPAVLVIPLASYSVARWVPGHASRAVLVAGAVGAVLAPLRWGHLFYGDAVNTPQSATSFVLLGALCAGLVVTPYAIGRRVLESAYLREQRRAVDAERASHNQAERDQQMRIAEATARAQIARELHDIVAHSLSVIIVQAEGGKALATKKPEAAAQVLGTIAESGREALGEMRRIVAVLRDGPSAQPEYAPTPGLDDIPDLVARSGARVHLDVVGQVPRVPQTLGLTAYRIVQEALTNVLRHAGPEATAQVLLSYSPHLVVVEVVDNGRGAASMVTSDGQGNGLRGMHERVSSMGGQLVVRPRSGGGFLVRALLPIVPSPSPAVPVPGWTPQAPPARATQRPPATSVPTWNPARTRVAPPWPPAAPATPGAPAAPAASGAPASAAPQEPARPAPERQPLPSGHEPTLPYPPAEPTRTLPASEPTTPLPSPSHPRQPGSPR